MKGKIDDQTLVLREHGIQVYIFHVLVKQSCSKDFLFFFWKSYAPGVEDEQGRSTAHDKMGMLYSVHNNIMAVTCNLGALHNTNEKFCNSSICNCL